ncbi:SRPBCC family protein [Psychrobacter sp. M13]|uniref:SRPBCC family protein n=1 Tax=Psychrobacter sp. M13 TaxID=3067275 RepID=UPI00273BCEC0|nr:SRPBCC family protein [Psychrobacter sp. M13]WLP95540.1 SRPBCC family protein [Psychrobacter sp. M13]
MFKIKVERIIKKPIDEVFEALSDHASYGSFKAVGVAKLVTEGDDERNGVGALRTIQTGPVKFWERITAFERPTHMQYQIEKARPVKMQHDKGIIDLKDLGDGTTRVTWVSEGRIVVPLPLIGRLLDRKMQKQGTVGFSSILKAIESR